MERLEQERFRVDMQPSIRRERGDAVQSTRPAPPQYRLFSMFAMIQYLAVLLALGVVFLREGNPLARQMMLGPAFAVLGAGIGRGLHKPQLGALVGFLLGGTIGLYWLA